LKRWGKLAGFWIFFHFLMFPAVITLASSDPDIKVRHGIRPTSNQASVAIQRSIICGEKSRQTVADTRLLSAFKTAFENN